MGGETSTDAPISTTELPIRQVVKVLGTVRRYAVQYIVRYQLKPLQSPAYKTWLQENEALLKENAPEGWAYVGTWFTVRGFGHYQCESRWEVDDYGSLGAGWGNETFQRLMRDWMEFANQLQDSETYLMKSAADVDVFE
jgi:hypothetical protein